MISKRGLAGAASRFKRPQVAPDIRALFLERFEVVEKGNHILGRDLRLGAGLLHMGQADGAEIRHGGVRVFFAQRLVAINDGHVAAERAMRKGHLDSDRAAADDNDVICRACFHARDIGGERLSVEP